MVRVWGHLQFKAEDRLRGSQEPGSDMLHELDSPDPLFHKQAAQGVRRVLGGVFDTCAAGIGHAPLVDIAVLP
jgi:hypothetical protein